MLNHQRPPEDHEPRGAGGWGLPYGTDGDTRRKF